MSEQIQDLLRDLEHYFAAPGGLLMTLDELIDEGRVDGDEHARRVQQCYDAGVLLVGRIRENHDRP